MKFYIYTLGCKVNSYESEVMCENLISNGFIKGDKDNSSIYIVNTCTVTNTSDNKSLKVIRQIRREHSGAILVVCGCFSQSKYNTDYVIDADIVLGNKNKSKVGDYINDFIKNHNKIVDMGDVSSIEFEDMRINNFDRTRAFVKIQDGCNNFCSYCIIPYVRGGVRSKKPELVISEVTNLINDGHREIVLTGIHTGHYGSEFDNYNFACLLCELVNIKGLERLRISSIEITEITDTVLDIIKNNSVIVDHVHIPLQSGSDYILKMMNRKYDKEYFINRIKELRRIRPLISVTTDVIVGFPLEDEDMFLETIDTIKKIKFSKIHVFPFSPRAMTEAAKMHDIVGDVTRKDRVSKLINLSKELEIEYMESFEGKIVDFIPEVYKDGYLIGHSGNYLCIKCKSCGFVSNTLMVKITDIVYPYCIGDII